MSVTDNTTTPAATADKFAVVEALYRYAAGLDLRDRTLLASAFAEDAVADFGPATRKAGFDYPEVVGNETIAAALADSLSELDTTHSVSTRGSASPGTRQTWRPSWPASTCRATTTHVTS